MLAGTGSDVGKSVLATALCRIFRQDGYRPAPFKAQNMALNSYATPDGLEIGRAQAVQAEAAGLPPMTDMNPLLLKPSSDHTSQVVLNGRPIGNRSAYDYFRREGREELRSAVHAAFDRLAARYCPIVMEGAGSIAEINLRDTDLVNMPMARHADARVILVADIDRGGVFASAYGSIMLQTPEDRQRIIGIIINKFRGDLRLFEEGRRMMEDLCGVPVLGVVPYLTDVHIEEEDSVALSGKATEACQEGKVNVAVVRLRHLSNFTDFDALERDPRIHLFYSCDARELRRADILIVPGSKSTLDDLAELRRCGAAQAILQARHDGATVMGICGGFQMMGREIHDPEGVEGERGSVPGLDLLPVSTVLTGRKVTRQVKFRFRDVPAECEGYEIHMGRTEALEAATPSCLILGEDGATPDGCWADSRCFGTYIHGILDNPAVVDALLAPFHERLRQAAPPLDYRAYKEQQYDLLARRVRECLDMERIYRCLER
jgi:adenosylcobyric acid synthase